MNLEGLNLKEILLNGNYVTPEDIAHAEEYAQSHHATVLEFLLGQGMITKELLGQAIAESYGISFVDISKNPPGRELVLKIPAAIAEKYHVVVVKETDQVITIATSNPAQTELGPVLYKLFPGKDLEVAYAFPEDL